MSELKATTAQEIVRNEKDCDYMDELFGGVKMPPTQVYLKSEADAFIADLEESNKKEVEQLLIEIVKLKEGAKNLILDNYLKDKEIRHHKYKRCLAMSKWCNDRYILDDCLYELGKTRFYERWEKRWLKLAEKFKEKAK